jgi:hypothetical protein
MIRVAMVMMMMMMMMVMVLVGGKGGVKVGKGWGKEGGIHNGDGDDMSVDGVQGGEGGESGENEEKEEKVSARHRAISSTTCRRYLVAD